MKDFTYIFNIYTYYLFIYLYTYLFILNIWILNILLITFLNEPELIYFSHNKMVSFISIEYE